MQRLGLDGGVILHEVAQPLRHRPHPTAAPVQLNHDVLGDALQSPPAVETAAAADADYRYFWSSQPFKATSTSIAGSTPSRRRIRNSLATGP